MPILESGNMPLGSYSIASATYEFEIKISDTNLDGTISVFNFMTTLSNGQFNTNLTISVSFFVATAS
jgi:hypothetical protein